MGDAMGGMLPSAVGVAISPLPIVAVVLMLVTARGRVNGVAFIVGWMIGLVTVGAVFLTITSDVDPGTRGEPATWVSGIGVLLGIVLLSIALRQWRRRPRGGDEIRMPRWMAALDRTSPRQAAAAGVALSALNPKNLLLGVLGAAAIARSGGSADQQAVAYATFVLIATIGVGAPVAIFLALGGRSRALLDALRRWMARNNAVLVALLLLVVGVKLIGDGISQLRSRSLLRCPYVSSRTTAQSAVTLLTARRDVF
jgi:threonine/homoserine/homoserine lactone efflux protein